jgi:hypothetical protein
MDAEEPPVLAGQWPAPPDLVPLPGPSTVGRGLAKAALAVAVGSLAVCPFLGPLIAVLMTRVAQDRARRRGTHLGRTPLATLLVAAAGIVLWGGLLGLAVASDHTKAPEVKDTAPGSTSAEAGAATIATTATSTGPSTAGTSQPPQSAAASVPALPGLGQTRDEWNRSHEPAGEPYFKGSVYGPSIGKNRYRYGAVAEMQGDGIITGYIFYLPKPPSVDVIAAALASEMPRGSTVANRRHLVDEYGSCTIATITSPAFDAVRPHLTAWIVVSDDDDSAADLYALPKGEPLGCG